MTATRTFVGLARVVPVTRGLYALVDEADFDACAERRWSASPTSTKRINHYATARFGAKLEKLHRFIMGAKRGDEVDHLDGDGLNCTRQNLRVCDHYENMQNRRFSGPAALSIGLLPPSVCGYFHPRWGPVFFPEDRMIPVERGLQYLLSPPLNAAPMVWRRDAWGGLEVADAQEVFA